jgi:hypothetical protein
VPPWQMAGRRVCQAPLPYQRHGVNSASGLLTRSVCKPAGGRVAYVNPLVGGKWRVDIIVDLGKTEILDIHQAAVRIRW